MNKIQEMIATHGDKALLALMVFGFWLIVAYVASFLVIRLGKKAGVGKTRVYRLIASSQKALFIIIGLISAMGTFGVNVSALVAGLGLTGFAFGFALKDAISNLVAGIMIIIYKPFDIGDTIEVLATRGVVTDIDFRYITIKTEQGTSLIPSSSCISNKISRISTT